MLALHDENMKIRADNAMMRQEIKALTSAHATLLADNVKIRALNAEMQQQIKALTSTNAALLADNRALKINVGALKTRAGLRAICIRPATEFRIGSV